MVSTEKAKLLQEAEGASDALTREGWTRRDFADALRREMDPDAMSSRGIDGGYDRSVGGLAIYNPKALQPLRLLEPDDHPAGIPLSKLPTKPISPPGITALPAGTPVTRNEGGGQNHESAL